MFDHISKFNHLTKLQSYSNDVSLYIIHKVVKSVNIQSFLKLKWCSFPREHICIRNAVM